MSEEHQVNLFARYEQRLLSGDNAKTQVIPAVVITGFLGSGKTTLVNHILRNRGSLRIAVLINEVGQLDVDSQLVNAKQGNAALGLPAVDLSGGCICCSRAEDLEAALRRLRAPPATAAATAAGPPGSAASASSSAPCDYLLVETSGAADAGPLAEALVRCGFRLDAVVAVVDAEAGREALMHPVALAQIGCADVVVLNKCDLLLAPGPGGGGGGSGLGALADLEDLLEGMAPGVRLVRARYGEVPLTAVLDVEPAVEPAAGDEGGGGHAGASAAGAGGGGGGGGFGFMSHESMPAVRGAGAGGYRRTTGPLTADGLAVGSSRHTQRRAQVGPTTSTSATATASPSKTHGPQQGDDHHHHHHHKYHVHGSQDQHAQKAPASEGQAAGGAGAGDSATGLPVGPCSLGSAPAGVAAAPASHVHDGNHDHIHIHSGGGGGGGHAALHSGFHTESVTAAERPIGLVAFAAFVVGRLVREPALLRSKGVLWFGERRGQRFTFHLSGRRRVEMCQEGPWEGPPASQLVLIGTDAAAMQGLREAFVEEVVRQPQTLRVDGDAATVYGGVRAHSSENSGVEAAAAEEETETGVGSVAEGAAAAVAVIAANERLEVLDCELWGAASSPVAASVREGCVDDNDGEPEEPNGGSGSAGPGREGGGGARSGGGGGGGLVVQFTTRGSALHGINPEELNGELLRRANASGRVVLAAVTAPGKVSAVTNVQSRDRVLSLLLPCNISEAQEQAGILLGVAEPLLRKAYAHVHNCKCDVASVMQTFTH